MSDLRLFFFVLPRIESRGQAIKVSRRKGLALIVYLAILENAQSRESIASLFWPDLDQVRARGALRSALQELTTLLPPELLFSDRSTIALQRDAAWIDVREFLSLSAQSR